jgi:hypothetical protein
MVNADAQLFTIEGLAAAMIMIMTLLIVVNTTSVYTPGDAHINDMQLEVLGTDALRMMDTADRYGADSPLKASIDYDKPEIFKSIMLNYTNNRTLEAPDSIRFNASYTCRNNADNTLTSYALAYSDNLTGTEHPVRVTRWVRVHKAVCDDSLQDRAVLVEVLLWRD